MTHKGSHWEKLVDKLMEDPRFDFFQTNQSYHHPDDLKVLFENIHRRDNAAAIWSDVILHNKDFTCQALRSYCKFIYWNSPCELPEYQYRLQGMQWYYQKTGGLWLESLEGDSFLGAIYG